MTNFERIVRPFQTRDVTPPQLPLGSAPADPANVLVVCGEVGATKIFNESASSTLTSYMVTQHKEKGRATTTKRIKNPSDETQFVDVEYIDALRASTNDGGESVFKYKRKP